MNTSQHFCIIAFIDCIQNNMIICNHHYDYKAMTAVMTTLMIITMMMMMTPMMLMMTVMMLPIRAGGCWRWEDPTLHCFATVCFPISLKPTQLIMIIMMMSQTNPTQLIMIMMMMTRKIIMNTRAPIVAGISIP